MPGSSAIPFVVGITGHRDCDPACHEAMRSALLRVLDGLVADMPATPIFVVSGLAAGADQLASEWALEWGRRQKLLPDGGSRVSLVVALPMPLDDYAADFLGDPPARAKLDALLAASAFTITIAAGVDGAHDREAAYANLGSFLAEQSQLLVAFWDGARTLKRGGTYHVIQKCVRNDPDAAALDSQFHRRRHLLVTPTDVDVRIIPVRRVGAEGSGILAGAIPATADAHADFRARLDRLNSELTSATTSEPVSGIHGVLARRFEVIDGVASRMKRSFLRHVTAISLVSVLAILCFQVFNFMSSVGWAALGYIALTAAAMAWFSVLRHYSSIEWVFVYARAIAEAMRVQLAWSESGMNERVSDLYMSRRSVDVGLLRRLVAAATIETFADGARRVDGALNPAPARDWIDGQRRYMSSRIAGASTRMTPGGIPQSLLRAVVRFHAWIIVATVAVLCVAALVAGPSSDGSSGISEAGRLLPLGFLLIGCVLFVKSGIEYHDSAVLQREDIDRFRQMLPVYDRASSMLSAAQTDADRRRILSALGKEAIDENAEWFVKHTDALKLPTVG